MQFVYDCCQQPRDILGITAHASVCFAQPEPTGGTGGPQSTVGPIS